MRIHEAEPEDVHFGVCRTPALLLEAFCSALLLRSERQLFVVIDECDHFANALLSEDLEAAHFQRCLAVLKRFVGMRLTVHQICLSPMG